MGFVIIERGGGRDRDLGGAGIGAQAQIDAEDIAIPGGFGQQPDQALRQRNRRAARIAALVKRKPVRVVKDHQIDVAGIIQFMRAEFAHRQNGQAALRFARRIVLGRQTLARRHFAQQETQSAAHCGIGKDRQRAGDLIQGPAVQIGKRDGEGSAALGGTQSGHSGGFIGKG